MSHSKRKTWSDSQKLKIVIDVLSEKYSKAEVSKMHQVHPNQIKKWTEQFLERAPKVFSNPGLASKDNPYKKIEELERIIGQQTIENKVLKKTLNYCN